MLLYFTHKSHTGILPVIVCKGTKKQAQYKTKFEVFAIIVEQSTLFWGIMCIKEKNSKNFLVV